MTYVISETNSNESMSNTYNLLREACGISQAEAAKFVHETRLDSVKSWCSDRRSAPQGVINDLQKLAREIQNAGIAYASIQKEISKNNIYIIGLPRDEEDARKCNFPSVGAQMRAIGIAISHLPADGEFRMVERIEGAIPAPVLEKEPLLPTQADTEVLIGMRFSNDEFYTKGNVNRRKYNTLEEIGWLKGITTNISDVLYYLTKIGKVQLALLKIADEMQQDFPDLAPNGFQSIVNVGLRKRPMHKLKLGQKYELGELSFHVEKIDNHLVTATLLNDGTTMMLYAPTILL